MNSFKPILEAALLFILVFNILQVYKITNQVILTLLAILVFIFFVLSANLVPRLGNFARSVRLWCLILTVLVIHISLLFGSVLERLASPRYRIHDGALITEESFRAIISGKNPYSISYDKVLVSQEDYLDKVKHRETDKNIYSPMAFFINFPTFLVTSNFFNFIDMRITAVVCFLVAAFLALLVIKEKILFLILFLLNPVFLKSVYFGANDIFILFFLILCIVFLNFKKIIFATFTLALGVCTKLLFLPFVPLYFLYMSAFGISKNSLKNNFLIFFIISLSIYLPFILMNPKDFLDDMFVYNFLGGSLGRPIAGFVGVPQFLNKFGIVAQSSSFPYFILLIPLSLIFLYLSANLLKRRPSPQLLVLLYAFFFILVFSFSRIVQSDYLSYLSEVLILAAFLSEERLRSTK